MLKWSFVELLSLVVTQQGGALEIPYNCIGIGIFPSVFQLNLMSVPSSHHLNYLVSWHEHPHGENAHFYDYYEDPGLKTEKVWAEQLIAVAVIDQDKLIHTVFQPPRSEAGIRFLRVSLTKQLKVVKFKQVELDETSVTFRDVLPGQYKVIISPHGGVCDIDPNLCRDISSECVSIGENSDVVTDNSTEGTLITVLLVSGVVIILVVLGVMALQIRWKYRKKRESEASAIFLTSMACRELEKHVTSYFCTFLSVALHTSVTFTLPLLHPDRSKVIDASVTNHEVEARQSLVTQPLTLHKFFRCFIILKFSYATKKSGINSLIGKSDGNLSERSFSSQGNASYVLESILQKVPSKEVYFVTFKQESYSADTGIAYTIYEDSENGIISEDQITVLNDDAYHLSHSDNLSLCNRIDSYTYKNNHQNTKEYLLPSDINELYEDLRSQAYSKAMHLSNSEIIKIDYWLLAVTMFGKAAENQPGDNASDNMINDVGGDTETIPERDSIQDKQQEKLNILPNYKRQYSHPPGFSLPHYQIHKNHSNNHFAVLPHALSAHQHNVVDSFPKITTDENDDLLRISQRCDTTAIETSADNHNSLILKSVPAIVNESLSSCSSYSNLTDAEKDIEFQIIQNQSKKNSEIKKMAETLAQGSHSFVCARTFISRDNTLHVDLPASRCQGQMQKSNNTTGDLHYQPSKCSNISDYDSLNTPQSEDTQSTWNCQNTYWGSSDCKDTNAASNLLRSDCCDRDTSAHKDTLPVCRSMLPVHIDSLPAHSYPLDMSKGTLPIKKNILPGHTDVFPVRGETPLRDISHAHNAISSAHKDISTAHNDICSAHRNTTSTHGDTTPIHWDKTLAHRNLTGAHSDASPAPMTTLPVDTNILPPFKNKNNGLIRTYIADNANDTGDGYKEWDIKISPNLELNSSCIPYPVDFEHSLIPPQFL